jgi:hypothetical protein
MPIANISEYLVTGLLPDTAFEARLVGTGETLPYQIIITQSAGTGSFSSTSAGVLTIQGTLIVDTDNDGISDNVDLDDDGDRLPDSEEILLGTNPFIADTDGDGVNDELEVAAGTDPLSNTSTPVLHDGDVNNDGLVNTADLIIAIQILIGQRLATPIELAHLDVAPLIGNVPSVDGQFNLGDYLVLQRKVIGIISF